MCVAGGCDCERADVDEPSNRRFGSVSRLVRAPFGRALGQARR